MSTPKSVSQSTKFKGEMLRWYMKENAETLTDRDETVRTLHFEGWNLILLSTSDWREMQSEIKSILRQIFASSA